MINVKVEEKNENSCRTYPCIMTTDDDTIVLFCGERKGTVLFSVEFVSGLYDESWVMGLFKPFTGTITLSNGGEE